jgi:hypothetical protein
VRQRKAERAAELEGDITISNGIAKQPAFSFGSSRAILTFTSNLEKIDPNYEGMHLLYNAGLRLELEKGAIQLSTLVRDRQGRLVASIVKNHWSVTSACLDKNYSNDSLEILDARGLVIFQMRLLSDHVELQGEWRDEFGNGVRLLGNENIGGGNFDAWHDASKEQQFMKIIPPMFKYPSANHWGERKQFGD